MRTIDIIISDGQETRPKILTPENLLEPDPASTMASGITLNGIASDGPPWPERQAVILRPRLSTVVPREIASIFEAGQATMAYGYYFYPLYAVGMGHIWRAFEAAAMHRAVHEGLIAAPAPKQNTKKQRKPKERRQSLADALNYLRARGVISASSIDQMNAFRELRNSASHLSFQQRIPPGWAVIGLDRVSSVVEMLVGRPS